MSVVLAVRDSVVGVFRIKPFAKSITSSLVITPLCSSNSPMASSSYIEPMIISTPRATSEGVLVLLGYLLQTPKPHTPRCETRIS